MRELTVNKFRANLRKSVEDAISNHEPLRVTRKNGQDFVIMSAEDWEKYEETLYVLQNSSLMKQISESFKTNISGTGYKPSQKELDEINRI